MILSIAEKIVITVVTVILTSLFGAYNFSKCADLNKDTDNAVTVTLRFLLVVVAIGTVSPLMMYFLWR